MELPQILELLSRNKKVLVRNIREDNIMVKMGDSVLMLYPKTKTAEFLDIPEEWDELPAILEGEYKDFPELKRLYDYMIKGRYQIIF